MQDLRGMLNRLGGFRVSASESQLRVSHYFQSRERHRRELSFPRSV
jgi:hypothetical protein